MAAPTPDALDRLALALLPIVFPAPPAPDTGAQPLAGGGDRPVNRQDRASHA